MKKIILAAIVLIGFASCKQGWTEKEREQFLGGCIKGSLNNMDTVKAKLYCTCMLTKLQKRYPYGINVTALRSDSVVNRMAKQCYKQ